MESRKMTDNEKLVWAAAFAAAYRDTWAPAAPRTAAGAVNFLRGKRTLSQEEVEEMLAEMRQ